MSDVRGSKRNRSNRSPEAEERPSKARTIEASAGRGRDRRPVAEVLVMADMTRKRLVNGLNTPQNNKVKTPNASQFPPNQLNPVIILNKESLANMKRKSLGMSFDTGHGSPVVIADDGNRDEALEKRQRHQNRAFIQRRSFVGTPLITPREDAGHPRKSLAAPSPSLFNPNQLKQHYSDCIVLSASNKINVKNAFGLHLIDYMSELLKNTNEMNFKLASSALDAGTKIYCHRVDCVHAEAQKVASGLVMALDKNGASANENADGENPDENEDGNEEDAEANGEPRLKKKRAAKKSGKTLAEKQEVLNGKTDTFLEIDPVFKQLSSAFDMGAVNGLFMANLKCNSKYELLLDSNAFFGREGLATASPSVSIGPFVESLTEISESDAQICPKLAAFVFMNRDESIDIMLRSEGDNETTRGETRSEMRKDSAFTFDLNADVEDDDNDVGEACDPFDPGTGFANDDEENGSEVAAPVTRRSLIRAVNLEAMTDLVKVLSDKPNDYTYFNKKITSAWAGPNHWKANPFARTKKAPEVLGEPVVKGKKTRKQYEPRNYCTESLIPECDKMTPKLLKLKVPTLTKWSTNTELLLPRDHCYNPLQLAGPFNKTDTHFKSMRKSEDSEANLYESRRCGTGFDGPSSPLMDMDVGLERDDGPDDDDGDYPPDTQGFPTQTASQIPSQFPMIFSGENLVDQPFSIEKINLPFAKFAKKMDVKRLKRAFWDVLTDPTPSLNPTTPEVRTMAKEMSLKTTFGRLYHTIPSKITPLMATNLSAPIAFVTLLHLANEKNLRLIGREDLTDFMIEPEPAGDGSGDGLT